MKKLDIYLDTSIWNFLFADDAPEKKERTIQFFESIERGTREEISYSFTASIIW